MLKRLVDEHKALIDAFRTVWREREAALDALAVKEIALARGLPSDPPIVEEREQFERTQAAVEHAFKRIQLFEYRHGLRRKGRAGGRVPAADESRLGRK
jgi:hypothetical protein